MSFMFDEMYAKKLVSVDMRTLCSAGGKCRKRDDL